MTPEERAVHALTGMMMRTEDSLINMVTEQIQEACDEARKEQLVVDQRYWSEKLFLLKQDKKLAAVFFEELWRTRWEELADAVDKMGTSYLPQDIIDARQRVEALLRDVRGTE